MPSAQRRIAGHRLHRTPASATPWQRPTQHQPRGTAEDVVLDLGWGRLVFGNTFDVQAGVVDALRAEESGRRDICVYPRDPQVLVGLAPDELFVDPSYTYRLDLHRHRPRRDLVRDVLVRTVASLADVAALNRVYARNGMVPADELTMWRNHRTPVFSYLVAEDVRTGQVVGTVTGIDHVRAFGDPEAGTSLWCLAVDPQDAPPGALVAQRVHDPVEPAEGLAEDQPPPAQVEDDVLRHALELVRRGLVPRPAGQ